MLNLGLAWVVGTVEPPRLANRLLAAAFALNALHVLLLFSPAPFRAWEFAVNLMTLVPLLILPVVVPWQRLQGRALHAWMAACAALVLLFVAPLALGVLGFAVAGLTLPYAVLIHGAAAFALLLLLDAYLGARSPLQHDVAFVFLVAFALRASLLDRGPTGPFDLAARLVGLPLDADFNAPAVDTIAARFVLAVAILAVPLGLFAARVRGRLAGRPWPWRRDAAVLGAVVAGYAFTALGVPEQSDYFLLRPVLLSYGILQVQFLAVDVRRNQVALVAALVAGLLASFLLLQDVATRGGLGAPAALGLGLFVALGASVVLGVPLLRPILAPVDAPESRRDVVYRAALEAAAQEGQDLGTSSTLRALRQHLGLTERDHAAMVRQVGAATHGFQPGALFRGRYRIARRLGAGASGEVYLARDEQEGRDVAVKRLAGHLRRDARALARYEREVRLSRDLRHPHIVGVHEVELVGGDAYLVLEYAEGGSLQDRLDREGPLPEEEARRIARDVAEGLAALHARGIVHRDVKPSNVLLAADGRALLADFTLAQEAVSGETVGATGPAGAAGTPAYMSPEQARGTRVGPPSDVYSLGATLYAAVAGRPPVDVEGQGDFEARLRVARDAPALPVAEASPALNDLLARALARYPEDRPEAATLAAALADPRFTPRGTRAGSGPRR